MSAPDPGQVEYDLWADPWQSGLNSQLDRDMRFVRFAEDLGRLLRDVEVSRWRLQCINFAKLGDPRMAGFRGEVEKLRARYDQTFDDVLAALPPEPDAGRERLVDRLLAQARGGE